MHPQCALFCSRSPFLPCRKQFLSWFSTNVTKPSRKYASLANASQACFLVGGSCAPIIHTKSVPNIPKICLPNKLSITFAHCSVSWSTIFNFKALNILHSDFFPIMFQVRHYIPQAIGFALQYRSFSFQQENAEFIPCSAQLFIPHPVILPVPIVHRSFTSIGHLHSNSIFDCVQPENNAFNTTRLTFRSLQ